MRGFSIIPLGDSSVPGHQRLMKGRGGGVAQMSGSHGAVTERRGERGDVATTWASLAATTPCHAMPCRRRGPPRNVFGHRVIGSSGLRRMHMHMNWGHPITPLTNVCLIGQTDSERRTTAVPPTCERLQPPPPLPQRYYYYYSPSPSWVRSILGTLAAVAVGSFLTDRIQFHSPTCTME